MESHAGRGTVYINKLQYAINDLSKTQARPEPEMLRSSLNRRVRA